MSEISLERANQLFAQIKRWNFSPQLIGDAEMDALGRAIFHGLSQRAEGVAPRVDLNDKGHLDEVVSNYCHLEQMDGSQWFLDAGNVRVWLFSKSKITASFERSDMNSLP